ncbi:hypothetical protein H6P81_006338 [Aristolochia fimbriata]|uniref:RNase H type-1 domain-containing protein n=1 Tax=Aristolochia fimbriata TaxID=158543 RepID=A0AAV7EXZ6_ARIFI|nr:hypothetical protein H6P81_006338 [Aristolochia fimbriata]
MPFKRCPSPETSSSLKLPRAPGVHPTFHFEPCREMPAFQSSAKERYTVRVGRVMQKRLQQYKDVPHKTACARCSNSQQTAAAIHRSTRKIVQKLRHYLLAHSTNFISRADPLKYIMSRPILSGRLAKWALLLSEFEINFVPQRAIKGQALASFLADHPVLAEWELTEEFPDEEIFLVEVLPLWEMYFDGAARRNGAGAGILFVSPKKDLLPYSFVLTQICSNNEAEYQALLLGLGIAVEMQLPQLHIHGDSALVIKQLTGEFEVKKLELEQLWRHAGELLAQITKASLHHVPRPENGPADALAGIAASLAQFDQRPSQIPICERWVIPPPAEEET